MSISNCSECGGMRGINISGCDTCAKDHRSVERLARERPIVAGPDDCGVKEKWIRGKTQHYIICPACHYSYEWGHLHICRPDQYVVEPMPCPEQRAVDAIFKLKGE